MPDNLYGGLMLSLIDLGVVFIVLVGLAFIIKLISFCVNGASPKANGGATGGGPLVAEGDEQEVRQESEDGTTPSPGVLAAIAAAVSVFCDKPALGRVAVLYTGDDSSLWTVAGRQRLMSARTSLVRR
jgi:Na+-transporting methylmalonyl-CoA/oxaloacetate decarboxylase gamma subunit